MLFFFVTYCDFLENYSKEDGYESINRTFNQIKGLNKCSSSKPGMQNFN